MVALPEVCPYQLLKCPTTALHLQMRSMRDCSPSSEQGVLRNGTWNELIHLVYGPRMRRQASDHHCHCKWYETTTTKKAFWNIVGFFCSHWQTISIPRCKFFINIHSNLDELHKEKKRKKKDKWNQSSLKNMRNKLRLSFVDDVECCIEHNAPLAMCMHYLSDIRPEPARGLISFWYQASVWYLFDIRFVTGQATNLYVQFMYFIYNIAVVQLFSQRVMFHICACSHWLLTVGRLDQDLRCPATLLQGRERPSHLNFKLFKMKLFRASQSSAVHIEAVLTSNQSPVWPVKIFQTFIDTVVCKRCWSQSFRHQSTSCAKIHTKAVLCSNISIVSCRTTLWDVAT